MRIWKLIGHHKLPDEAIAWSLNVGRIAVGWGKIGDLRALHFSGSQDISTKIRQEYPEATNAHLGGPSLWSFFHEMDVGDLVILVGKRRRACVVEVTGPYSWTGQEDSFSKGDYQHQRMAVLTEEEPDQLWHSAGAGIVDGYNTRWTLALCSADAPNAASALARRYSEGSRYDIVATRIERNPEARKACIKHHGVRCAACDLDFAEKYADLGCGFIHVHHLKPFADASDERTVDPVRDLIPLCPNCHAMVHRRRPPLTVEELKGQIRS